MRRTLLYTEGRDDVAAATELLTRLFGLRNEGYLRSKFSRAGRLFTSERATVDLTSAGNRERAGDAVRERIGGGEQKLDGFDHVALLFDPDGDDDAACRRWLREKVLDPAWDVEERDVGYGVRLGGLTTHFVPIPWDAGPSFDDLDEARRCLERVALAVLQQSGHQDGALCLQLLTALQDAGRPTSWKTAFRLFNAVRKPSTEAGFMARVFGQDKQLREHVEPVLQSTVLWDCFAHIAGV